MTILCGQSDCHAGALLSIHQYFHNSSSSKDRCGADSKLEHGYRDASSCSGHSCQNNNNITRAGAKICLFFTLLLQSLTSGMLAPPRPAEKRAAPPRAKQALPRPAPQKLTKPAGRDRAKLTVDYTDYAHTFGLRVGK